MIKFLQIYSDKERRLLCLKTINNMINSEFIKKELTEESKTFIYNDNPFVIFLYTTRTHRFPFRNNKQYIREPFRIT